mmetsp:Transcript_9318/g.19030  ORF Transcript_9318/g.19030 Transcript_9318/m.19030 type:complete len:88 (+) Transcript_9318:600-863(+)
MSPSDAKRCDILSSTSLEKALWGRDGGADLISSSDDAVADDVACLVLLCLWLTKMGDVDGDQAWMPRMRYNNNVTACRFILKKVLVG